MCHEVEKPSILLLSCEHCEQQYQPARQNIPSKHFCLGLQVNATVSVGRRCFILSSNYCSDS